MPFKFLPQKSFFLVPLKNAESLAQNEEGLIFSLNLSDQFVRNFSPFHFFPLGLSLSLSWSGFCHNSQTMPISNLSL